jgi:hypothetical protein
VYTMTNSEIVSQAAKAADVLGAMLPSPASTIFRVAGVALGAAVGIMQAGLDPVAEITRILKAAARLAEVEDEWSKALDRKFGTPDETPTKRPEEE